MTTQRRLAMEFKVEQELIEIERVIRAEVELIGVDKFDLNKCVTKLGFRWKNINNGSCSRYIWVNRKKKIVVKRPFICQRAKLPPNTVPTHIITLDDWQVCFIQPLVDVTRNAVEKAYEYFLNLSHKTYIMDLSYRNVGIFQGNPVMIDW